MCNRRGAGAAEVELLVLAFSRDGTHLAAMSGAPDLQLSVWELKSSRMLCSVNLSFAAAASSFNPRSAASLCVRSPSCLQLWTLKQSYQHHSLEAAELQPGDEVGGGLWGCHTWGTADEIFAGTDTGAVVLKEPARHEPALAFAGGSAIAGLLADSMHILVGCRDGSLTWYSRNDFTPLFELRVASPISSMAVSADYFKLLISTTDGAVEQACPSRPLPLAHLASPRPSDHPSPIHPHPLPPTLAITTTHITHPPHPSARARDCRTALPQPTPTPPEPHPSPLRTRPPSLDAPAPASNPAQVTLLRSDLPAMPLEDDQLDSILSTSRASSFHVGAVVAAATLASTLSTTTPNATPAELVTVGEDGTLRCYDCASRAMLAATRLGDRTGASTAAPTAVAASGAVGLIAAGTSDGLLRLFLRRPSEATPATPNEGGGLQLVLRARVARAPLSCLAFDDAGHYLAAAASADTAVGVVCFFGLGQDGPELLGAHELPSSPTALCWFAPATQAALPRLVVACTDGSLLRLTPPPTSALAPIDMTLPSKQLQRAAIKLASPALALTSVPVGSALQGRAGALTVYAACADGALKVYEVDDACRDAPEPSVLNAMPCLLEWSAHQKPPTCVATSPDGLYVATGGSDGVVIVRSIGGEDKQILRLHDSYAGGVSSVVLTNIAAHSGGSSDGLTLQLLSTGGDGVLYVSSIVTPYSMVGKPVVPPATRAIQYPAVYDVAAEVPPADVVDAGGGAAAEVAASDKPTDEPTVLEAPALARVAGTGAARAVQSAATGALQDTMGALRGRLLKLIATNAAMEDGDPEKLPVSEFIIDQEQQQKWREEGNKAVAKLRRQLDVENLAKELLASRYKGEFWEAMHTKATTLHALQMHGAEAPGGLSCARLGNFTLTELPTAESALLLKMHAMRRAEGKASRWELDSLSDRPLATAEGFEVPKTFGAAMGVVVAPADSSVAVRVEDAKQKRVGDKKTSSEDGADEEDGGEGEAGGGAGGGGAQRAGGADEALLYPFQDLHPHWRKATQALLYDERVRVLKQEFNGKFSEMLALKRAEIERIAEKKARAAEVVAELAKLRAAPEAAVSAADAVGLHIEEEPEKVLAVHGSEISASKFVSAEERARLEKLRLEAEARAAAAGADNLGDRGLKAMMNGTLEVPEEEEEVMIDLEKPEWMTTMVEADMTDDERAQLKEFAERQKKLEAEREKRAKGGQTELTKLHQEMAEICRGFNERLAMLCDTKTSYEQAVYENELLVIKLGQARLRRELFLRRETELEAALSEKTEVRLKVAARLAEFRRETDNVREAHEALAAEDKGLERAFRRDFLDAPEFLDLLVKLYKRRRTVANDKSTGTTSGTGEASGGASGTASRRSDGSGLGGSSIDEAGGSKKKLSKELVGSVSSKPRRGSMKGLAGAGGALLAAAATPLSDEAPAEADVASLVVSRDPFSSLDVPKVAQTIEPLDPAIDMPEGLNFDVWDRLVEARAAKIAAEQELKACAEQLAEMAAFLDELDAVDVAAHKECDELAAELQSQREAEKVMAWNLELPFKLKQGQLEVEEAAVVTDYSEAVFIQRDAVKELNADIKKLGLEKVEILKEVRDFRRGIALLQWDNTRADMEAVDLTERVRDLQLLRVTKDLQQKMKGGGEEKQQVEVAQLERKLEQLKANHEERAADLKRQVAAIKKLVAEKQGEMGSLKQQIEQLEGSVLEREMIHEIQSKSKDSSSDSHKRFEEVHMKRKLQTLVGMQTQEIELLREELDRLRRRTFPTFTQYEQMRAL